MMVIYPVVLCRDIVLSYDVSSVFIFVYANQLVVTTELLILLLLYMIEYIHV